MGSRPRQPASTPRTDELFARIVELVSNARPGLSVGTLAAYLDVTPEAVAQCIALHVYFDAKRVAEMPIPPPSDYCVPGMDKIITRGMLDPPSSGRMPFVEAQIEALSLLPAEKNHAETERHQ